MLLAGDIGATKTLLGLFTPGPRPEPADVRAYTTLAHDSLETILAEFLSAQRVTPVITAASFGVAGPIIEQVAELTNVPWRVDAAAVAQAIGLAAGDTAQRPPGDGVLGARAAPVRAGRLAGRDPGGVGKRRADRGGDRAWRGAAAPAWKGGSSPRPTEGGHADFAPRTPREIGLLECADRPARPGRLRACAVGPGPGQRPPLPAPGRLRRVRPVDRRGDEPGARSRGRRSRGGARAASRRSICSCRSTGRRPGNLALRSVATRGRLRRRRHRAEDPAGDALGRLHGRVPATRRR